jgi:hypothetical protein
VATGESIPLAILFFSFINPWVMPCVIGPFWRGIDNLSFLELLPGWPAKWRSVKRRKWGSGQGRERIQDNGVESSREVLAWQPD